jgi:hypothetical protein
MNNNDTLDNTLQRASYIAQHHTILLGTAFSVVGGKVRWKKFGLNFL